MKILTPGIFHNFPPDAYFADPCPAPSLTQTIAKVLCERSPRHAWVQHPRLNPAYEPDDATKYDIGNVAHALLIGRGRGLVVLDYDSWRKNEAQERRAAERAAGKLAVLRKDHDRAQAMVDVARAELEAAGHGGAFADPDHGEVVLAWQEDGIWLRTMIDWMADPCRPYDYKTTGMSVAPHVVAERPSLMGWDVQAAMHERGLDRLDKGNAGRRKFHFVCQEDEPPHALTVVLVSEADLTLGRKKLQFAIDQWRRCIEAGAWPGYPAETVRSQPRSYTEAQWLEREIEHHDREQRVKPAPFDPNVLLAG